MIDEGTAKPTDGDVSPYLQQPLRTLETAQLDRIRREHDATQAQAGMKPAGPIPWHGA